MIDFLIRAWFEKREKQTKSAFFKLKESQFKDRVSDIQSFCNGCWNSEEWKDIEKHCSYWFHETVSKHSHYVYQELKEKYEAFAKACNAPMELLIDVYNSFYDDIWKNTDLDVSEISVYRKQEPIGYGLYCDYKGNYKPEFDHYAKGWTREWHEAYCTMANLMLLIRKCCDVIDYIQCDLSYQYLYPDYSFFSIKRDDKPHKEDNGQEIYEKAKKQLEAEMNADNNVAKAEAETKRMKLLFAGYYKQSDPDECCSSKHKCNEETSDLIETSDFIGNL